MRCSGPRGAELAARLRARTPWVMIDEFQDTDPDAVAASSAPCGCMPRPRGLAIVGDPKQAIYGFRGADVATYVAARDELLRAGATRVALDVNRRSTAQLVEAVNDDPARPDEALAAARKAITYDEPVRASGDDRDATICAPPITVFALQSGTGPGRRRTSRSPARSASRSSACARATADVARAAASSSRSRSAT